MGLRKRSAARGTVAGLVAISPGSACSFPGLSLLDSLVGMIAVYTAFALPVTIWTPRDFAVRG